MGYAILPAESVRRGIPTLLGDSRGGGDGAVSVARTGDSCDNRRSRLPPRPARWGGVSLALHLQETGTETPPRIRMPLLLLPRNWAALAGLLAMLLALCGTGLPAAASPADTKPPAYYPITLEPDGSVKAEALDQLAGRIHTAAGDPHAQFVVLVHGYNTSGTLGRRQYRQIARDLTLTGNSAGWHPVVIGVHWPSHPGPLLRWLPQMLGYRFISGTGFPKALTNPYLEKSRLAARAGRTGLRAVLFRLRADYPRVPLHVFAHSMGSELVIRALSPEAGKLPGASDRIVQPTRLLQLGMVVLAGADLDQDVFSPEETDGVPQALDRAAVWWITVPRKNTADAALELRRSAGRREALGNVGLSLKRSQLQALLARRALVIDSRKVPIVHDILAYFTRGRLESLADSLGYLAGTARNAKHASVLQELDKLLALPGAELPQLDPSTLGTSERVYLRWRLHPERSGFGPVRVPENAL